MACEHGEEEKFKESTSRFQPREKVSFNLYRDLLALVPIFHEIPFEVRHDPPVLKVSSKSDPSISPEK